jgi:hypothetical protein
MGGWADGGDGKVRFGRVFAATTDAHCEKQILRSAYPTSPDTLAGPQACSSQDDTSWEGWVAEETGESPSASMFAWKASPGQFPKKETTCGRFRWPKRSGCR